MSDTVAVMHRGSVVQVGRPDEVYRRPATPWVAGFMGDANFVSATADGHRAATSLGDFPTTLTGPVSVMIRPEHLAITADPAGPFRVTDREYFGHDQLVTLRGPADIAIRVRLVAGHGVDVGGTVGVTVGDVTVFAAP